MSLIDDILSRPEFDAAPPVLVDIGASGALHAAWKPLAKYAICLAFDPDARNMDHVNTASSQYRKLIVTPAIVTNLPGDTCPFYLTRAPYCSSMLRPDSVALADWSNTRLFEVERETTLPIVRLPDVLAEHQLEAVDWFKTDSQGLDWRLFESMGDRIDRVLAADFEPGIIDIYQGEDKIETVLPAVADRGFWLCDIVVKGPHRLPAAHVDSLPGWQRRFLHVGLPVAPGWAEMRFMSAFDAPASRSTRDCLLMWVIATCLRHHGFAMDLALRCAEHHEPDTFHRLAAHSRKRIGRSIAWRLPWHIVRMLWLVATGKA